MEYIRQITSSVSRSPCVRCVFNFREGKLSQFCYSNYTGITVMSATCSSRDKAATRALHPLEESTLELVMRETLYEMIIDLAKVAPTFAMNILKSSQELDNIAIMKALRTAESNLCQGIAEACATPAMKGPGEKYLSIFGIIQPSLKPVTTHLPTAVPAVPATSSAAVKAASNNKKKKRKGKGTVKSTVSAPAANASNASNATNPSQMIQGLLNDTQDKDLLLSLADSIFHDLDLGDRANEEMSMPDMLALMTKAGSVVQSKVQSGDLDVARLQEQALAFCEQIQHNPDLQNIISSNPVLASMQLDARAQTTGDQAESSTATTPGIQDLLMSAMSTYGGMN